MDNLGIGEVITTEQHRDAVHFAIAPVVAAQKLKPGQHVGFIGDKVGVADTPLGIVDPFLAKPVKEGEKFWLFLYPNTVTGMRHEWMHPAFESEIPVSDEDREKARHVAERLTNSGERWLRNWCATNDSPSYESIMEAVKNGGSSATDTDDGDYSYGVTIHEDYVSVSGSDAHGSIPPEFWDHVEAVTGKKQVMRPTGFSCSC